MDVAKRIYIEIEALLDVRLAILGDIDPVVTKRIVEDRSYFELNHHRYNELDPVFTPELLAQRWENRNGDDLSRALATNAFSIVRAKIRNHTRPAVKPFTEKIEVTVDLGQFVLRRDEVVALKLQLEEAFSTNVILVNSIVVKRDLINLLQYDVFFIHDFDAFMSTHIEGMKDTKMFIKEIYAPLVLQPGAPTNVAPELLATIVKEALMGVVAPDLKPLRDFRAFNMT